MGLVGILFAWSAKSSTASRERAHLRHPMRDTATLTSMSTGDQALVELVDLSAGGARIHTSAVLSSGDQITLALRVASDIELQLSARVVHTLVSADDACAEYGVRFHSTHAADRRLISQYVSDLAARAERAETAVRVD